MQLSIVIVNYNVRHFLEQCLYSVMEACKGLQTEVIVVDNNSQDGSVAYLGARFPLARFIANDVNVGFAKACNQGWKVSKGEYVLFLNPDTIVSEGCFRECLSFLETHPGAGAVGVKMLDGSGRFLRESKRAFPSPSTSFYKLTGIASLFPRAKRFARYHLGHLDENAINEVDVLAGAFIMVKRIVLESINGFDEQFFMYGEDVDLSYRIQKAGFVNYYFPNTPILHFKGESTRKGTLNYVRMFYNAMSIFVRKHYGGGKAGVFNFFIHVAIWLRAFLSAVSSFIRKAGLPLIDAALILLSFWTVKNVWTEYIRPDISYENRLLWIAFPAYTIFFLVAGYYAGLYDKWYRWTGLMRAMVISTILLLAAYSLLPEHYRFSRGIIVFGALGAFLLISMQRWLLTRTGVLVSQNEKETGGATVIVGTEEEFREVMQLLSTAGIQQQVLGRISPHHETGNALGSIDTLDQIARKIPFQQIILCQGNLSFADIIAQLQKSPPGVTVRIHAAGSEGIVTSRSKDSSGEIVSRDVALNLASPYNRRLKRLLDAVLSFLFLVTFPIHIFLVKKPGVFITNCFKILVNAKTWIGYTTSEKHLPPLKPAVLGCNGMPANANAALSRESLQMIDYWYARDYEPLQDLKLILRRYRMLGN